MNLPLNPDILVTANAALVSPWPGFRFTHVYKHDVVVTCEEAAFARGVPLDTELKTIVLSTKFGLIAVHLPANLRLHSGKIKKVLETRRIRFATKEELGEQGLQAGLVNPNNSSFCYRHLICRALLDKPYVTTNAGVFTLGVAFAPSDLLSLRTSTIGDFSHA